MSAEPMSAKGPVGWEGDAVQTPLQPPGLTQPARVAALSAAAVLAVAVLLALQLLVAKPAVEDNLAGRAATALTAAGLGGVSVTFDGRDALASGAVDGAAEADEVLAVLSSVPGVGAVSMDGISVLSAPVRVEADVPLDSASINGAGGAPGLDGGAPSNPRLTVSPVEPARMLAQGLLVAGARVSAVTFIEGSADLTPQSLGALDVVANAMLADTSGQRFVIRTHTDTVGGSADNQWLSERRAAAVCDE